jgi:hypothetical protein
MATLENSHRNRPLFIRPPVHKMTTMSITSLRISTTVSSKANLGDINMGSRDHGYDNCKMIFMLLVVLWHAAQLSILEATLSWGSAFAAAEGTGALADASISSWYRAINHQLHHHSAWMSFISRVVTRYWLWTEKLAVPGFSFLSGYFWQELSPSHIRQAGFCGSCQAT